MQGNVDRVSQACVYCDLTKSAVVYLSALGKPYNPIITVKVKKELAQSEPNSRPRNLNGKQPKLQIDIIQRYHMVNRMSSYFTKRWPLSYVNLNMQVNSPIHEALSPEQDISLIMLLSELPKTMWQ